GEQIRKGDRLRYSSNGGGGFGPPRRRAPEAVAHDVSEGYFGPDLAAEVYGVVLTETESGYAVDQAATAELRANGLEDPPEGYGPGQVHPMGRNVVPHPA
ncbi:MAG: hydantoinase B/oxoprolinase family protein, partial [Acidimicrobiia bacterium]|nr:hydantoinase B/oxoprolinase family protein [Acidimicrobiia bacterium]